MKKLGKITVLSLAGALIATLAVAQQDPLAAAVKARQAHMGLYAFNLGTLGGMAQDAIPYDAAAAQAAADNLVALTGINQMAYWPAGTAVGEVEGTRAKPELWANMEEVMADSEALTTAALAMQAAAGTGLDALKAAMGPLGGACGECHEEFRQAQ